MMKRILLILVICSLRVFASEVINQDNRPYQISVKSGKAGALYKYEIKSRGALYGACGGKSYCTFEIPGDRIVTPGNAVVYIRGGKFIYVRPPHGS